MVFTSHVFLFYFLPAVLLIYYLLATRKERFPHPGKLRFLRLVGALVRFAYDVLDAARLLLRRYHRQSFVDSATQAYGAGRGYRWRS